MIKIAKREPWVAVIEQKILDRIRALDETGAAIREQNIKRRLELEDKLASELSRHFRIDHTEARFIIRNTKKR